MTENYIDFPSQAVSDLEKLSEDYGLRVAKAIKQEWFAYRQALRDITTTYPNPVTDDDDNLIGITWPTKPTTK